METENAYDAQLVDLGDLVTEYLDRLNDGERVTAEQVFADHPGVAQDIVEELRFFVQLETVSDETAPLLGTLGDYTLRRQIGRGGMGVVYEAWQSSLDRQVALKTLPSGAAANDKAFHRFMREAKTTAKLSHANIVGVHGVGIEQNTPYYAMELVEGDTLAQILEKIKGAEAETETPFGKKDDVAYFGNLARAFAAVADGLQHAHSKGVIHRDIKPSNLILDGEGRLRILDFGLAGLEGQDSLTRSSDFIGTPLYMSPEQARRRKIPIDHRTDIYSLGATMYESLVGRPPFVAKDHHDTLYRIIRDEPIRLRRRNRRIPLDLETIILKCLMKNPAARYETAESLAEDLKRFASGDPVSTRAQPAWERVGRRLWSYRHRASVPTVLTAVLLAGLFAALLVGNPEEPFSDRIENTLKALRPVNVTTMRDIQRYRRLLLPDLKSYGAVDQALRQEVLIPEGDSWRFLRYSQDAPTNWRETSFDDSTWDVKTSPFESEVASQGTEQEELPRYHQRFHLRHHFSVPDPAAYRRLYLWVAVRDGVVVYLNGEEFGRRGVLTPGSFGTIPWGSFVRPLPRDLLRSGDNVLAVDAVLRSSSGQSSLIPVLVGEPNYDASRDERVFQDFLQVASGESVQTVRQYLEGRIAQRAGRYEVAARLFEPVAAESQSPEPALRLAECLRAAGFPEEAEARLRALMKGPLRRAEGVGALWAGICLGDLDDTAADLRKRLKELEGVFSVQYVEDVLDRLVSGKPIRINCGANHDYGTSEDGLWSSDRFYRGGFDFFKQVRESDPLCDWLRWWAWDSLTTPGYSVPLPSGRYELTLMFLETNRTRKRVFGVSVEDEPFARIEPKYGSLEKVMSTVDVRDGWLEINLDHDESAPSGSDTHPYLSAIEIRRFE